MKFLICLSLAVLAAVCAAEENLVHREITVPVIEQEGRITNGKDAAVGQFPYQVGLSLKISVLQSAWCGGSLISNNWVLTAAHCTDGVQSVTVYLGATVRTSAEASYTVQKSDIILHSGWNPSNLKNDISLIKIPSVAYTSKIQPIRLPAIAKTYSTYTGATATASGWGRTSDTANGVTNYLQYAELEIISNTLCAGTYGLSAVTSGNICAATPNGISTCQGDSGGPLVLIGEKVQIGLTSYGAAAGCQKGHPVVFTRLTSYLDWIKGYTGVAY